MPLKKVFAIASDTSITIKTLHYAEYETEGVELESVYDWAALGLPSDLVYACDGTIYVQEDDEEFNYSVIVLDLEDYLGVADWLKDPAREIHIHFGEAREVVAFSSNTETVWAPWVLEEDRSTGARLVDEVLLVKNMKIIGELFL